MPDNTETSTNEQILSELKKISGYLEPKPAPPPPKGMKNEFVDFISKYKVMGLAVAFILGVYVGAVVQSLAKDLILPAIGLAFPGLGNLATYSYGPIRGQMFMIGDFLSSVITFIIVAFVIFIIVKLTTKVGIE